MILKHQDVKNDEEIEFGSKEKFREKQAAKGQAVSDDPDVELCQMILEGLGGKDNIADVTNCATRLRVNVKDETICKNDAYFKAIGTHGCSVNGKAFQVYHRFGKYQKSEKYLIHCFNLSGGK